MSFQVTLITLQKLSPSDMADTVKKYYSQVPFPANTVWMVCCGMLDFIDLKEYPVCLNQKCESCLHRLFLSKEDFKKKPEGKVKEVMKKVYEFKTKLDSGILSKTLLLMVPPMPLVVLNGGAFQDHQKLHTFAEKYDLFICDHNTISFIRNFYSHLYDAWPLGFGSLGECIYQHPQSEYILKYKRISISILKEKDVIKVNCVNNRGNEWIKMMKEMVIITQTKYPIVLSAVNTSSYLTYMPFISLIEYSPTTGKMLSLDLQKRPDEEDRIFRQIVVVGSQLPAELDKLCQQLSIHVVPERVTFDGAGQRQIQNYQKLWPKDTLWVILADVLHIASLKDLKECVQHNCKAKLKAYYWFDPPMNNKEVRPFLEVKIRDLVCKVKNFSESLSNDLGEGSALFLPPVTPVLLLHTNFPWRHQDLHSWYTHHKEAPPVFISKKNLNTLFSDMKKAWLMMLEPYLAKYPMLMKILDQYKQNKEDWITTLGNFLVYFANAKKDADDAVFSDAGKGDYVTLRFMGTVIPQHSQGLHPQDTYRC